MFSALRQERTSPATRHFCRPATEYAAMWRVEAEPLRLFAQRWLQPVICSKDHNIPVDKGVRTAAGGLLVGYACLHDRRRRRY
jgi:hypothetical protein